MVVGNSRRWRHKTNNDIRSEDFIRQQSQGTTKDSGDLDWVEHTPVDSAYDYIIQNGIDLTERLLLAKPGSLGSSDKNLVGVGGPRQLVPNTEWILPKTVQSSVDKMRHKSLRVQV